MPVLNSGDTVTVNMKEIFARNLTPSNMVKANYIVPKMKYMHNFHIGQTQVKIPESYQHKCMTSA